MDVENAPSTSSRPPSIWNSWRKPCANRPQNCCPKTAKFNPTNNTATASLHRQESVGKPPSFLRLSSTGETVEDTTGIRQFDPKNLHGSESNSWLNFRRQDHQQTGIFDQLTKFAFSSRTSSSQSTSTHFIRESPENKSCHQLGQNQLDLSILKERLDHPKADMERTRIAPPMPRPQKGGTNMMNGFVKEGVYHPFAKSSPQQINTPAMPAEPFAQSFRLLKNMRPFKFNNLQHPHPYMNSNHFMPRQRPGMYHQSSSSYHRPCITQQPHTLHPTPVGPVFSDSAIFHRQFVDLSRPSWISCSHDQRPQKVKGHQHGHCNYRMMQNRSDLTHPSHKSLKSACCYPQPSTGQTHQSKNIGQNRSEKHLQSQPLVNCPLRQNQNSKIDKASLSTEKVKSKLGDNTLAISLIEGKVPVLQKDGKLRKNEVESHQYPISTMHVQMSVTSCNAGSCVETIRYVTAANETTESTKPKSTDNDIISSSTSSDDTKNTARSLESTSANGPGYDCCSTNQLFDSQIKNSTLPSDVLKSSQEGHQLISDVGTCREENHDQTPSEGLYTLSQCDSQPGDSTSSPSTPSRLESHELNPTPDVASPNITRGPTCKRNEATPLAAKPLHSSLAFLLSDTTISDSDFSDSDWDTTGTPPSVDSWDFINCWNDQYNPLHGWKCQSLPRQDPDESAALDTSLGDDEHDSGISSLQALQDVEVTNALDSDESDESPRESFNLWNSFCSSNDPYNPLNGWKSSDTETSSAATVCDTMPEKRLKTDKVQSKAYCPSSSNLYPENHPQSSVEQASQKATIKPSCRHPSVLFILGADDTDDGSDDSDFDFEDYDSNNCCEKTWDPFQKCADPMNPLHSWKFTPTTMSPAKLHISSTAPSGLLSLDTRSMDISDLSNLSKSPERPDFCMPSIITAPPRTFLKHVSSAGCLQKPANTRMTDKSHCKKVHFCEKSPTVISFEVQIGEDNPRGPWEDMARDRHRFMRRIHETEDKIGFVFTPEHRCKAVKFRQTIQAF